MKVTRGLHGTPIPGGEEVGYYRFEFDHPGYQYDLTALQGDALREWVDDKIAVIRATVARDAERFDAVPSNFLSAMSYELRGIGSRETDELGNPAWEEGQRFPMWREYRDFTVAVRELLSRVQAIGDNDLEKVPNATSKPGSKPVYYKLLGIVVRVITEDLRNLGREARDWFAGKETARRKRIGKKIKETRAAHEEAARKEALKERARKAAATRKRNAEAKRKAEEEKRKAEEAKREAYRQRALKAAATRKANAEAKRKAEEAKREAYRQRALKAAATRKANAEARKSSTRKAPAKKPTAMQQTKRKANTKAKGASKRKGK